MTVTAGVIFIVIGFVVQWRGVGPEWLSWRIAQVCVLAGLGGVLEPVAGDLRGWWTDGLRYVADAVSGAIDSEAYTRAILTVPAQALTLVAFIAWLGAFLSGRLARWMGPWVSTKHTQAIVWAAGIAMVLFGRVAGGNLSDAVTSVTELCQNAGGALANFIFGGA
jgi:hypothetical protein